VPLREYRVEDIEAMFQLDVLCFEKPFRFSRGVMRQFAESANAIVVIAEDDLRSEDLAGFLIVHLEGLPSQRYGYVVTIDVAPASRRTRIGSSMLLHAEQQARNADARRMGLHVEAGNESAIRFYERQGYLRVGVAHGFYREAGLDALVYIKPL